MGRLNLMVFRSRNKVFRLDDEDPTMGCLRELDQVLERTVAHQLGRPLEVPSEVLSVVDDELAPSLRQQGARLLAAQRGKAAGLLVHFSGDADNGGRHESLSVS